MQASAQTTSLSSLHLKAPSTSDIPFPVSLVFSRQKYQYRAYYSLPLIALSMQMYLHPEQ